MIAVFGIGVIVGLLASVGVYTIYDVIRKHFAEEAEIEAVEEPVDDEDAVEDRHRMCAHNLRNIAYYDEEAEGEY